MHPRRPIFRAHRLDHTELIKPAAAAMSGQAYTLQGLRDLYRDLLRSHAEATAAAATGRKLPRFKERLIETIRSISELIIYGE